MATRSTGLTGAATARAPSEARQPQSECGSAAEDDSFDVWLRRDLHRSYDATLAEPIPAQLLRLIEESDIP